MLNYDGKTTSEILSQRVPEEMDFPKVLLLDTVSFCNLKCSMCPHKEMTRKPGFMSWELYRKLIDEIAENEPHAQIWITYFGEGMLLKDLPEKIKYARDKGLDNIILNSNGCVMRTDFSERLIKSGLNGLYVGIDAIKPETHTKLRVGGNLEKVTRGVLEYKSMLEEFGAPDQRVMVQFVEMEANKDEVEDFVDFWHGKHGILCKVRPMVSWAGKVEATNLQQERNRLPCYWAMNTINITDKGLITMCSVDLDCQVQMGEVNTRKIKDIWHTELKTFRMTHRNAEWDKLPEMCRLCNDWQSGYAQYV